MALKLITPPTVEPITVLEVRERLGITDTGSDPVLYSLIIGARQSLEGPDGYLQRSLNTQTWDLFYNAFPSAPVMAYPYNWPLVGSNATAGIQIPLPPLIGIVSVNYIDENGDEVTINPENYVVDTVGYFGWVVPASGFSWPSPMSTPNAVRIRFTSGYGPYGDDVPEPIRQWIVSKVGMFQAIAGGASSRSDPMLISDTVEGIGSQKWAAGAFDSTVFSSYSVALDEMLLVNYRTRWPFA